MLAGSAYKIFVWENIYKMAKMLRFQMLLPSMFSVYNFFYSDVSVMDSSRANSYYCAAAKELLYFRVITLKEPVGCTLKMTVHEQTAQNLAKS